MTISDTATKFRYQGNGATTTFAFSGKAFTAADLDVQIILRSTSALVETLTLTTDYSVTIASNGTASIVVTNGTKIPSSLQDIQIRRNLDKTQTTVLPTGTKFPAKAVESAIDRAIGIVQDLNEAVTRSLKFPVTSATTVATLPEPVDDKVLCCDGTTGLIKLGATNTSLAEGATTATAQAVIATTQATTATTQAGIATTKAAEAAVSAASVNLPSVVAGSTTKLLKVNAGETGFELGAKLPNFVATKRGTILVQNANDDGFEALSQGTSGQFLASAGADALPTWGTVSQNLVLLSTQTASASASISFDSTYLTATYKSYIIEMLSVVVSSDGADLLLTASIDNGSSYLAGTDYTFANNYLTQASATPGGAVSAGTSSYRLNPASGIGNAGGEFYNGVLKLLDFASTRNKALLLDAIFTDISNEMSTVKGSCRIKTASTINNIKFVASTGNITSGIFKLYGVL